MSPTYNGLADVISGGFGQITNILARMNEQKQRRNEQEQRRAAEEQDYALRKMVSDANMRRLQREESMSTAKLYADSLVPEIERDKSDIEVIGQRIKERTGISSDEAEAITRNSLAEYQNRKATGQYETELKAAKLESLRAHTARALRPPVPRASIPKNEATTLIREIGDANKQLSELTTKASPFANPADINDERIRLQRDIYTLTRQLRTIPGYQGFGKDNGTQQVAPTVEGMTDEERAELLRKAKAKRKEISAPQTTKQPSFRDIITGIIGPR